MSEPKRKPVEYLFQSLNFACLRNLTRIAQYSTEKYGSFDQYVDGPLHGEKSPINHAMNHIAEYCEGKLHDHFGDRKMQLVAAMYNLMMEYKYLEMGIAEEPNRVNKSLSGDVSIHAAPVPSAFTPSEV